MKISQIVNSGKISVSCELFPPKLGHELDDVRQKVAAIAALRPSYMSVTYGAGGGNRENAISVASEIQNVNNITALAHLTCVLSDEAGISSMLEKFKANNICNILALRGDSPAGNTVLTTPAYKYASELVAAIKKQGDFCVGGACYPEGHPESETQTKDIDAICAKVDAGCEFLTSQMFFDNDVFYNFMYKLLRRGIKVPVVAGIMPVTSASQINRIFTLSGAPVPPRFKSIVDRFGSNPAAMRQAGIEYATTQIIDLAANGINNIHLYTMNRPENAADIMANLSDIIEYGR